MFAGVSLRRYDWVGLVVIAVATALWTFCVLGPVVDALRMGVAVGSCHVHGQSLRDSPCLEGTVDGH